MKCQLCSSAEKLAPCLESIVMFETNEWSALNSSSAQSQHLVVLLHRLVRIGAHLGASVFIGRRVCASYCHRVFWDWSLPMRAAALLTGFWTTTRNRTGRSWARLLPSFKNTTTIRMACTIRRFGPTVPWLHK